MKDSAEKEKVVRVLEALSKRLDSALLSDPELVTSLTTEEIEELASG